MTGPALISYIYFIEIYEIIICELKKIRNLLAWSLIFFIFILRLEFLLILLILFS